MDHARSREYTRVCAIAKNSKFPLFPKRLLMGRPRGCVSGGRGWTDRKWLNVIRWFLKERGGLPRESRTWCDVSRDGTACANGGRRTYPINTPRLPIPVRSHAASPGVLYLSLPLSTHPLLQYRINAAPFHLVTLRRRRLDRCNAEICKALQMRVSGVKISNAVGLLFCHSFQIN